MSSEILAVILAGVAGLLGAVVGGAVIYALLNARDARRADRDRTEREAAIHALEHAVRNEIGGQMREGLETFAQAMEENRLKEVVKAIELGTLSRMVMVEELQLKALKRVLMEATEADPDLAELLEGAKSPGSLPAHAEAPYQAASRTAELREDEAEGEDVAADAVTAGEREGGALEAAVSPDGSGASLLDNDAASPALAETPAAGAAVTEAPVAETAGAAETEAAGAEIVNTELLNSFAVGPDGDLADEAVKSAAKVVSQPEANTTSENAAAGSGVVLPEVEAVDSLVEPGADFGVEPEPAAEDEGHRARRGAL